MTIFFFSVEIAFCYPTGRPTQARYSMPDKFGISARVMKFPAIPRCSLIAHNWKLNDRGHLTNITYSEIRERDRNTKRDRDSPYALAGSKRASLRAREVERKGGEERLFPLKTQSNKYKACVCDGHPDIAFIFLYEQREILTWKSLHLDLETNLRF